MTKYVLLCLLFYSKADILNFWANFQVYLKYWIDKKNFYTKKQKLKSNFSY